MSVKLPNGALIAISSGYGASKTMSAVTNANPAVATLEASHGVVLGDYIEITSGWSRLSDRPCKVGTVTTNDVQLAGFDTVLTSIYPALGGAGSVREITGWTQLSQIMKTGSDGGEQQFVTWQFLEADRESRMPTMKTAAGLSLTIADDDSLPGYILAAAANDDRLPRSVRVTLPGGDEILFIAYITLNKIPTMDVNQLMSCQVTFSMLNEVVRY